MKTQVTTTNYSEVPATVDNLLAGKCKQVCFIETENKVYQAHSLTEVLNLWKSEVNDKSAVLHVGVIV